MTKKTFTHRIGGKTFIVTVNFSEKARDTLEDKLKKLVKKNADELTKKL